MNNPSTTSAGRDVRQLDLVPPERLASCHAVVIGVGAIGRQVALQLAALGAPKLTLFDHDLVEPANLAPQGYLPEDLSRPRSPPPAKCAGASIRPSRSRPRLSTSSDPPCGTSRRRALWRFSAAWTVSRPAS